MELGDDKGQVSIHEIARIAEEVRYNKKQHNGRNLMKHV